MFGNLGRSKRKRVRRLAAFSFVFFTFFVLCFALIPGQTEVYDYQAVTVQAGDNLWTLTGQLNPDEDIRLMVAKTMSYNGLSTSAIQPGQVLYIPVKGGYES